MAMARRDRRSNGFPHVEGKLAVLVGALAVGLAVGLGVSAAQEVPRPAHQEAQMETVIIPIEGMSCSVCAARIKKTLTSIDGVSECEVNLAERNARVRFASSKLSPEELVAAVNGLGYRAGTPTEAR